MSKTKTKRYLVLLAAVGLVAAALGGTGTFASFNAEVSNTGNTFATGTLLLHDFGSSQTCTSEFDGSNLNTVTPTGCDVLFTVPSIAPGSFTTANLTLSNAGSLNASDIKFDGGTGGCADGVPTIGTLNASATQPGPITSLSINNLTQTLVDHTTITVTDGAFTQTFVVSTTTAGGAGPITVPVTSQATTHTFPAGSKVTVSASFGATTLCSGLQIYVIETAANHTTAVGCAYGQLSAGTCVFDPAFTLGGVGSSLGNTLSLASAVNGNAAIGLDAGKNRYFVIGIKAPTSLTNSAQNKSATFDLRWHIDQA
jgi:predicted ribosomally synthesized peptide with SipW-like signal peptide